MRCGKGVHVVPVTAGSVAVVQVLAVERCLAAHNFAVVAGAFEPERTVGIDLLFLVCTFFDLSFTFGIVFARVGVRGGGQQGHTGQQDRQRGKPA